ncbi:MAG: phenylalanine--tRNA ligase subunit beta [Aquificaceae bacterium]
MKIPFSWLSEFIDIDSLDPYKVAEELTLKSVETSLSKWDLDLDGVIFAKVVEKRPHPKREELSLYRLEVGEGSYLWVVSRDKSLVEGLGVLLALPHSRVGSMCVMPKDFDGITSQGMLLSAKELLIEDQGDGVLTFEEDIKPGTSAYDFLGFGEYILEIEPTPNRGDLLSVKGLSREISTLFGIPKKERKYPNYQEKGFIDIRVESKDCKRYRGAIVEGLKIKTSPLWLRRRLWQCGIKTINNVVDITNYLMLLEGQPLHAFDLEKLNLPVVIRDAKEGENIKTLMGTEKRLNSVNLLIADSKGPLALAGVVGGYESAVDENTTSILLESAYFDPYRIRKSSRSLGLQTESSYRFERNVDIEGVNRAQDLALDLILQLAGGEVKAIRDVYPEPYHPKKVFLSLEKYRRYTGKDFERGLFSKVLEGLEIPHELQRCGVEVFVPSHRSFDIQHDVDIIEEVLRVVGYEKVQEMPLRVYSKPGKVKSLEDRVREFMVHRGFSEVITFSFEDLEYYHLLSLPQPTVEIINPINRSQRFMRTSLLPSLLRVCVENSRNYNHHMAIFEIGKTFAEGSEEPRLGFLMTGNRSLFPEEEYTPYHALSLLQDLLNLFSEEYISQRSNFAFLHPNLQRSFFIKDEEVAYFGMLNPALQERLNLRYKVILGEVKLSALKDIKRSYKPLSYFPPLIRDISLLIDKGLDVDKLILYIKSMDLVEDMKVFSIYTDEKLGEGKKSVSFRITFRSREGTLSDQEVNNLVEKLLIDLEEKYGAKLR